MSFPFKLTANLMLRKSEICDVLRLVELAMKYNTHLSFELDSISTAAVFGISSNEGILDLSEDFVLDFLIDATGFSYGAVPIKISSLTYSEYAARGFNLESDFSPSVIPASAADGELLVK